MGYTVRGCPDGKIHGANVGRSWGRQDPGGPHVGPMNRAIWLYFPDISPLHLLYFHK